MKWYDLLINSVLPAIEYEEFYFVIVALLILVVITSFGLIIKRLLTI